jgi:hypothetical protein
MKIKTERYILDILARPYTYRACTTLQSESPDLIDDLKVTHHHLNSTRYPHSKVSTENQLFKHTNERLTIKTERYSRASITQNALESFESDDRASPTDCMTRLTHSPESHPDGLMNQLGMGVLSPFVLLIHSVCRMNTKVKMPTSLASKPKRLSATEKTIMEI